MNEVRCASCAKLLLKSVKEYEVCKEAAQIEIKCTKCKSINKYKSK